MFAARAFAPRYYAPRYFPKVGAAAPTSVAAYAAWQSSVLSSGCALLLGVMR